MAHDPKDDLIFDQTSGVGYLDPSRYPFDYDKSYFKAYRERDKSPMGEKLTAARVDFVENCTFLPPLDVGIGGGRFVQAAREGAKGFDINPEAVEWLRAHKLWQDMYEAKAPCVTFWDSLEHIPYPSMALAQCSLWVFVSIPAFTSRENILQSKHFKPGEHIWYFTEPGFINFMHREGFQKVKRSYMESELGREGIVSFAFKRVATPGA